LDCLFYKNPRTKICQRRSRDYQEQRRDGAARLSKILSSVFLLVGSFLSALSEKKYLAQEGRADDLTEMLLQIGVRKLSAHEIRKSHILPALSKSVTLFSFLGR